MEWTEENDLLLAESVLKHISENRTQLAAFEEVGGKLNRTSAECGFRWNAVVRHNYKNAIELAKKQGNSIKKVNELTFNKIEAIKDPKQDIKFWLDALNNSNITIETVKMLNECLQSELNNYLFPVYKIKTDPIPKEKMWGSGVSTLMFDSANLKYMGDLKASERLKNDSLCVIDNGQIRNLKDNEKLDGLILVQVNNFARVDKDNEYIEQGECVRYRTI